ncbi:AGAP009403-PA-like protein [Anopheles sinensis]|uniref:AGAP009403-PA-like protein n=1 Tax=Anopheles sinensis TaxID=74873 RepID=A0A084VLW4_ANOSI|nr:AGAP009403-PA-like protein [Anopheles sinensis]
MRRNWLLRCSILINVAVVLYIGSHLLIGSGNFAIGPAYIISDEEVAVPSQQQQHQFVAGGTPQQKQQEQAVPETRDVDNSNVDDSRFDVPTEKNTVRKLVGGGGDVLYQDQGQQMAAGGGGVPGAAATGVLNGSDIFSTTASMDLDAKLRSQLNCHDRDYEPYIGQRGDFWVLQNYIRAEHGDLRCYETITYTTHADYTFLDNLVPLLERWNAPVSLALHAPGTDFVPTINSIKYLRDCIPESHLVRQFVTFHIYFSSKHIPKLVPKHNQVLDTPYNCSLAIPYFNVSAAQLYKTQKKLLYPVNVGRNIARDAAMTHFLLASDIELYPNPGLVHKFLEMIARNEPVLQRKNPRVFPLPIFEVDNNSPVPRDKAELQELLRSGKAIPFHKRVCSSCHGVPKSKEWIAANETDDLGVFHIGKRIGYFVHWEPIYIGTHADPHYDERLSWEGKSDKMTQGYALCVLDYDFHILDNGFLVHKPGIKVLKKDPKRAMLAAKTNQLIKKIIYPELQVMYGTRKGCAV